MYKYQTYGLNLASERQLPGLSPSFSDKADVTINIGTFEKDAPGCHVHFNNIADYKIINGNQITVRPYSTQQIFSACLLVAPMAILLHQRDLLTMHASVVDTADGCLVFIADSGTGKSTIAASFFKKGFAILNDDVSPVDFSSGVPHILSGYPYLKLHKNCIKMLGYSTASLKLLDAKRKKYLFPLKDQHQTAPRPIKAIIRLSIANELSLELINKYSRFDFIKKHTLMQNFISLTQIVESNFQKCDKLISNNIPFYNITRPSNSENPMKLVKFVINELKITR